MNTTLKLRIIAIVMLGIPLAFTAVGVSFYQYRKQVVTTELMERAGAISGTLDLLFGKVQRASNRSRSFVLSGDPVYIQDYEKAVAAIPGSIARIEQLTANNPEQAKLIPSLNTALDTKLAYQAKMLEVFRQSGFTGAREILISDEGARLLELVRNQVSAVRSVEYRAATFFLSEFRDGLLLQLAVLLSLVLCGGIWMSMLSFTAIRGILKPVGGMIAHVKRITARDAVDDLPVLRKDEVGELAVQINAMTHSLREAKAARETARAAVAGERQNLIDAVEALDEGFAAFDADELLVLSNQKYREMYPELADIAVQGVSMEALLKRRAEFGQEANAKGRVEAWVAEQLADFRNPGIPAEHHMNNGKIIRKSEFRTRNGGTVGVHVDITLLKNTEAALRSVNAELDQRVTERTNDLDVANQQFERLNAELSTLIRSAPVAIMALDTKGKVTMWNPAAHRLTGYSESAARRKLPPLSMSGEAGVFEKLLKRASQGDNLENIELELRRRDSSPFIANIAGAPLWDVRGNLHGAIFILVDLTESRALQEQFQQSQKMEVVAELTAGVAHDFNNLLGVIISNLEMLETRVAKKGLAPELVAAALQASLSGVALNRQLLAFSHRQKLEPMIVDVRQTIDGLKALLSPILGEHIDCRIEIEPGLWPAMVDLSLLESAILNLAVNARDAMPSEGTLTISAINKTITPPNKDEAGRLSGDCVAISVSDTGSGMPAEVAARAFEPFFTTKGFGKGSGLGLSMVYGFVRQSGGILEIESAPDKGTSIHISLPRASNEATLSPELPANNGSFAGAGETILVVEDNEALRQVVVRQLQELGYETIEADSAKPALSILETDAKVDLMLTDIVMPGGMDGRALAGEAANLRPNLPVVFTSGFPATADAGLMIDEHDGFPVLAKPVRHHELARHVHQALSVPD